MSNWHGFMRREKAAVRGMVAFEDGGGVSEGSRGIREPNTREKPPRLTNRI